MTTKFRIRPRLSLLIPLVIAAGASADALTRLIPLDYFAFRGWEEMVLRPAPSGPFAPNKAYHNHWAYGDLANLGNYWHARQYRDERFTTDSYGFRNPQPWAEGTVHIEAILNGDSFSAGGGLSDGETLAAQLTVLTGKTVYNAAGLWPAKLGDLRVLRQRLKMERGVVVFQFLERSSIPDVEDFSTQRYQPIGPSREPTFRERLADSWVDLRISRAEILIRRAQQAWREGEGNPQVVLKRLANDDDMAFYAPEIATSQQRRTLRPDFFKWLADELAKDHLELLVVLVPNKYTVYEPLLMERDPLVSTATLDELEKRLRQAGVRVVNLAGIFRERAAADFKNREYLYWRDDTHWNARGAWLAAERIRDDWP